VSTRTFVVPLIVVSPFALYNILNSLAFTIVLLPPPVALIVYTPLVVIAVVGVIVTFVPPTNCIEVTVPLPLVFIAVLNALAVSITILRV